MQRIVFSDDGDRDEVECTVNCEDLLSIEQDSVENKNYFLIEYQREIVYLKCEYTEAGTNR